MRARTPPDASHSGVGVPSGSAERRPDRRVRSGRERKRAQRSDVRLSYGTTVYGIGKPGFASAGGRPVVEWARLTVPRCPGPDAHAVRG